MQFIVDHFSEIVFAALGVFVLVSFIVNLIKAPPAARKKIIYNILYSLCVKAEKEYGSKTGEIKKKEVIATFYAKYPWLSFFVSEDQISDMIDQVVSDMTKYFEKNTVAAENVGVPIPADAPEAE